MKKIGLFMALLLLAATTSAQNLKETLTQIATEAVDKATDGKLTEYALTGTWKYSAPGVKVVSDDTASSLLAPAIETSAKTRLTKIYNYVGIKSGNCSFTFNNDKTFTAKMGKRTPSGTYEYNASTHAITLKFTSTGASGNTTQLGSMTGYAYVSGTALQLVFPVTKFTNFLTKFGSSLSSLSTISTLLKNYKSTYIGFAFTK